MRDTKQKGLNKRSFGILLPVFSLPSDYGIGTFGKEAYRFVDFLEQAGASYWQVLPMGPTGYGDSPYQTFSTFAGNPYFIDLEALIEKGWLTKKDLAHVSFGSDAEKTDYLLLYRNRLKILRKAYSLFLSEASKDDRSLFRKFVGREKPWLKDYALFMALKDAYGGKPWNEWDKVYKLRQKKALLAAAKKYADEIHFREFVEYLFVTQWYKLHTYARRKGIEIIGDLPIYVAYDSADTWTNSLLFDLDKERNPKAVAGCPPDDFALTGQLWGNPLYRWNVHRDKGYTWWIKRFRHAFEIFDVLRIDHFRGFESYYAVPAKDPTAEHGKWLKGPGFQIFAAMEKALGEKKVIAEDLGFITADVRRLLKRTGYPGMKVLQFAFYPDSNGVYSSEYLPHRLERNCVVYTGTHDNETTRGWFKTLNKSEKEFVKKYLGIKKNSDVTPALIRAAFASVADTCVIPLADFLDLDSEARINTPSTLGGNWVWRMKKGACTKELAQDIRELAEIYGREKE